MYYIVWMDRYLFLKQRVNKAGKSHKNVNVNVLSPGSEDLQT